MRKIFLVTEEQLNVNVFKDGQLPYTVPLSSVAPGPDDVVIRFYPRNITWCQTSSTRKALLQNVRLKNMTKS